MPKASAAQRGLRTPAGGTNAEATLLGQPHQPEAEGRERLVSGKNEAAECKHETGTRGEGQEAVRTEIPAPLRPGWISCSWCSHGPIFISASLLKLA